LRTDPRGLARLPEVISGTSAGAMNAVLIAAGLSPEAMLDFWLDLADSPPVVASEEFFSSLRQALARLFFREPLRGLDRRVREARVFGSILRKHSLLTPSGQASMFLEYLLTARFDNVSELLDGIKAPYLFDTSPLKARLERAIGKRGLRDTPVRLAINTVDAQTGRVLRIVNHRPTKRPDAPSGHYRYEPVITPEMVLASASIPLLFNPVRIGTMDLWDGGLLVNTPLAPAIALGARRIIPVLVTPQRADAPIASFGDAVERLADSFLENAYSTDRKLMLERNAMALRLGDPSLHVIELFEALRPASSRVFNAGSYLYFERRALLAMHEAGQAAARFWLDRGPRHDRRESEG
jgi:predicted acylesterase/phospholipase RssA